MNTTGGTTTSAGDYQIKTLYTCPKCGGYKCDGYWVGDVVGRWCTCSNPYTPQGWYSPYSSRAPWECSRCHKIKAPHVDECDCN